MIIVAIDEPQELLDHLVQGIQLDMDQFVHDHGVQIQVVQYLADQDAAGRVLERNIDVPSSNP